MILEAIILAQLTGIIHECPPVTKDEYSIQFYSTDCTAFGPVSSMSVHAATPTCPDKYTLIFDMAMQPQCAKDIIKPTYK